MTNEIGIVKEGIMTRKKAEAKHLGIIQNIHSMRKQYLLLGKELYEMKESQGYKLLGYDYWKEYVEGSEIGLSRDTANRFIQIYSLFSRKFNIGAGADIFTRIEWSKLRELLPAAKCVKTKKQIIGLLKIAENHTKQEIRKLLKKAQKTSSPELSAWEEFEDKMFPENYSQEAFKETVKQFTISVKICVKRLKRLYDLWSRRTSKEVEQLIKLRNEEDGMGELVIILNAMNEELRRIMEGQKSLSILEEENEKK